jgi:glucose-6-phosphate isomerase
MKFTNIQLSGLLFTDGHVTGEGTTGVMRKIKDMKDIFHDRNALEAMDSEAIVYVVTSFLPVPEGTPGDLYFGVTTLYPGKVGDEYFMTKGHFHANLNRTEFYWGTKGEGVLILMDKQRRVRAEQMFPGSLHYIPGGMAHRVANTGSRILSFAACWPSDAGHNYAEIAENGFACRLVEKDGVPNLIKSAPSCPV